MRHPACSLYETSCLCLHRETQFPLSAFRTAPWGRDCHYYYCNSCHLAIKLHGVRTATTSRTKWEVWLAWLQRGYVHPTADLRKPPHLLSLIQNKTNKKPTTNNKKQKDLCLRLLWPSCEKTPGVHKLRDRHQSIGSHSECKNWFTLSSKLKWASD